METGRIEIERISPQIEDGCIADDHIVVIGKQDGHPFRREVRPGEIPPDIASAIEEFKGGLLGRVW